MFSSPSSSLTMLAKRLLQVTGCSKGAILRCGAYHSAHCSRFARFASLSSIVPEEEATLGSSAYDASVLAREMEEGTAAAKLLQSYPAQDARMLSGSLAAENAPLSNTRPVSSVKQESIPVHVDAFGKAMVEPFLESTELQLEGEELDVLAELLESAGVSRKSFKKLAVREKQLSSCTAADLEAGLRALEQLGVQKLHVADLVQEYPSILFLDLQTTLKPMLQCLEELGVEKQTVGMLLRYNPQRVVRIQNTHFRQNLDFVKSFGLSKQQVAQVVKSSPQILVLDLDTTIIPRIQFLRTYGLTEAGVRNVILHFPSILNASIDNNLLPKVKYLESIGAKNIAMVLNRSPSFFGLSIEKNVAPKIKKLEAFGLSPEVIGSVVERAPSILSLSIDNIEQKVKFFHGLGVTPGEFTRILRRCPNVLGFSIENNLLPKVNFLDELGVDKAKLGKLLANCPSFFQHNLDSHLRPLVAYLESIGVKGEKLATLVTAKPAVFTFSVDGGLAETVRFLQEIGLEIGTPAMVRAFCCCLTNRVASMQARLQWFTVNGYTHDEALAMARKQPSILTVGDENMITKMEFLLNQVGLSKADIFRNVALLTYSLELRLKPRHRLISWLKETDRLKRAVSMNSTMGMSHGKFLARYIEGDPEAAAIYGSPT